MSFWKPAPASALSVSTLEEDEGRSNESVQVPFNFSRAPLTQQRMLLPIYKHRRQILYAMENYGFIVIVGETGCGKSTQIPQFLFENGWCGNGFQVVCTQPRRIAAQTLAQRVSEEVGQGPLGETVGYTVRFDNRSSKSTKIKYVTDGMLLREATLSDPLLSKYSVVMVDEAHERNLETDALLGLLKKIRRKRGLRVIICSATIDATAFLNFFVPPSVEAVSHSKRKRRRRRWDNPDGNQEEDDTDTSLDTGTIISVDGRQHLVEAFYLDEPTSSYIRSAVETVFKIHEHSSDGDILCFLPTGEDVDDAIRDAEEFLVRLETKFKNKPIIFLPLYGSLPYNMQAQVFRIGNDQRSIRTRRAIFCTNIAETSVTVPRISYVIDSGLVKLPYFDPRTNFDRVIVGPVSQASAQQRAGRAGRIQPGQCFRLYTEKFFANDMEQSTTPEILRSNLTSFILTLKALGVDNILAFDLMDLPSVDALSHGLETLYALGAIGDRTELTPLGTDMSAFPTEPRVSRMLLQSLSEECAWEVLGVAACLQVRDLFVRPRGGARRQQQQLDYENAISEVADSSGDHVTFVNIIAEEDERKMDREECKERYLNYVALRRAIEVRNQLARFLRRYGRVQSLGTVTADVRSRAIRKCVTAGFFFNVAKRANDGKYYTIRGKESILVIPSQKSIFQSHGTPSEYIVFSETQDGARGGIELRSVSCIDSRWLRELAPHYWA